MLCEIKISTPEWMKENDGHLEIYSHGCDAAKKKKGGGRCQTLEIIHNPLQLPQGFLQGSASLL